MIYDYETYTEFICERNRFTTIGALTSKKKDKFTRLLQKNIVTFFFKKRDGTIRKATGTLNPDYILKVTKGGNHKPEYIQVYWDLEKKDWRSFRDTQFIKVLKYKRL